ncbi:E3 ubiquitin-protein ligase RNF31-like isoform X2 [Scleropages formosus]|uniref:E3 ubiquitin-protein ligase RNF31-like isoform X2 n=1 Tax=Scleropages formosus TaxID=113540 RepID=UPI0010FA77D3|nr:E3 ubiquitin-protein ligase RNF31-like isoform X2 [Scleropages formosus]
MTSFSAQLEELRSRAQDTLSTGGSAQDVKPIVQAMASVPLPLCAKYCHIRAESMVKENSTGNTREESFTSLQKLFTALSILEKYGLNLTSSNKPRYWRSVKHNNPVFKATVDSVKGGREVLCLYGYSNQQPDGLCFPDDVMDPDVEGVAAVTLEIMTLRMEIDMFIKGSHPRPEIFENILPSLKELEGDSELVSDAQVIPKSGGVPEVEAQPLSSSIPLKQAPSPETTPTTPAPKAETGKCKMCGGSPFLLCATCGIFCESCDLVYHRHPDRASHTRERLQPPVLDNCTICGIFPVFAHCPTCVQRLCGECDKLYHSHPERRGHDRITVTPARVQRTTRPSVSSWECSYCTTVNGVQAVLCETCDRPRLAGTTPPVPEESLQLSTVAEWQCKSCTVMNAGLSVLCEVCERPRLATRPPATPVRPAPTTPSLLQDSGTQWTCQVCTFANSIPAGACEMCSSPRADYTPKPPAPGSQRSEKPFMKTPVPAVENPDVKRQRLMKEEGLKLIQQIREAEKKGVTPEEVYAALQISKGSNVKPCDWLNSELPHLLDEICAMAASVQLSPKTASNTDAGGVRLQDAAIPRSGVQVSRAEAKQAWLATGGDIEKAVVQVLRDRKSKLQELFSLGFREAEKCEEALRLSGGEVRGALSILQRPQLEAFHKRVWSDQPEPGIDIHDPDRQRLCRRLLALYDLPSWGRCELALSLLQEPDAQYSLEDVVQAVRESHDRDFIRRVLAKECPCCLCVFPHSKMQSLTSCQCSVCCGCFQQHFTIAIRDKHIRDMVCPACGGPDINDPDYLNSYFSTLDIQLRDCLEPEVYDLFHKKLTEHALIKDPKFLWCCHCSFGFIYDGDQLKVTCLQCQKSFCAKCKKPWESQHAGLSCEQFQAWKRENDPEYQKQGLAGYLRDNGITCPNCRFQYALTKGGCMHFTCSQCRYQFCSGCNNPFHTTCNQCSVTGLHAHHPRDCLFYLRDWEPKQLQALLQKNGVEFNTEPPHGAQPGQCGVMEQKDEGGQQVDQPCGIQCQAGQAGLCEKHYKEYLVSLINGHSLDPALLFDLNNLVIACRRYQVDSRRLDTEDETTYSARLLKKLMDEVLLGDKVPRKK